MKKLLLAVLLLSFSSLSLAITEADLNNKQKAKLYEIYQVIDAQNQVSIDDNITSNKEVADELTSFDEATRELELMIEGVKSAYEKVKGPSQEFLETGLAKWITVIFVFNFFGDWIFSFANELIFFVTILMFLRAYDKLLLINAKNTIDLTSIDSEGVEYTHQKQVYMDKSEFPLIKKILMLIMFVWLLTIFL